MASGTRAEKCAMYKEPEISVMAAVAQPGERWGRGTFGRRYPLSPPHTSPVMQGCHGARLGKSAEADILGGSGTIVFIQPETPSA